MVQQEPTAWCYTQPHVHLCCPGICPQLEPPLQQPSSAESHAFQRHGKPSLVMVSDSDAQLHTMPACLAHHTRVHTIAADSACSLFYATADPVTPATSRLSALAAPFYGSSEGGAALPPPDWSVCGGADILDDLFPDLALPRHWHTHWPSIPLPDIWRLSVMHHMCWWQAATTPVQRAALAARLRFLAAHIVGAHTRTWGQLPCKDMVACIPQTYGRCLFLT